MSTKTGNQWIDDRGRTANKPSQLTLTAWRDILWRVWVEVDNDRVMLVSAGVTFYLLLALFPALAAFVSLYGFVADPRTIADHISFLGGMLPSGGLDIIRQQLQSIVSEDNSALSLGFIVGLCVALWSANNGIKALFDVMNIAYEETEKRSFIRLNMLSAAFTLGALLIAIAMILTVGVIPAALALLRIDAWTEDLIAIGRWPLLLMGVWLGISLIYRYGPSRSSAKWRWHNWGAMLATGVWIAASLGFSFYLQNFADYNATYGSLGAMIGLMMWTWISVMILVVGAEINAEMERQTAIDTTTGAPMPMGLRGAVVADTVAGGVDDDASAQLGHRRSDSRLPVLASFASGALLALSLAVIADRHVRSQPSPPPSRWRRRVKSNLSPRWTTWLQKRLR